MSRWVAGLRVRLGRKPLGLLPLGLLPLVVSLVAVLLSVASQASGSTWSQASWPPPLELLPPPGSQVFESQVAGSLASDSDLVASFSVILVSRLRESRAGRGDRLDRLEG